MGVIETRNNSRTTVFLKDALVSNDGWKKERAYNTAKELNGEEVFKELFSKALSFV